MDENNQNDIKQNTDSKKNNTNVLLIFTNIVFILIIICCFIFIGSKNKQIEIYKTQILQYESIIEKLNKDNTSITENNNENNTESSTIQENIEEKELTDEEKQKIADELVNGIKNRK